MHNFGIQAKIARMPPLTTTQIIIIALVSVLSLRYLWKIWRRGRSWQRVIGWSAFAIAVYFGIIFLVSGPGAGLVDRLPFELVTVVAAGFVLVALLKVCEVAFTAIDGEFPKLPAGVEPVNVHRKYLSPWMRGAAVLVILLAAARNFVPNSWRDNWTIATYVAGLFSVIGFWFLHYRARRFDYGRTALVFDFWIHWSYPGGELEAFTGLDANAPQETWLGPAGILYVGEYAPWDLSIYQLTKAALIMKVPARIYLTFQQTTLGNSTSTDVLHVPIPEGHLGDLAVIEAKLRALCPKAQINLSSENGAQ